MCHLHRRFQEISLIAAVAGRRGDRPCTGCPWTITPTDAEVSDIFWVVTQCSHAAGYKRTGGKLGAEV